MHVASSSKIAPCRPGVEAGKRDETSEFSFAAAKERCRVIFDQVWKKHGASSEARTLSVDSARWGSETSALAQAAVCELHERIGKMRDSFFKNASQRTPPRKRTTVRRNSVESNERIGKIDRKRSWISITSFKVLGNGSFSAIEERYEKSIMPLEGEKREEMLPPSMMSELTAFERPPHLKGRGAIKTFALLLGTIFVGSFLLFGIVPFQDPFVKDNAHTFFILGVIPLAVGSAMFGVSVAITNFASAPLPKSRLAAIGISCGITSVGMYSFPLHTFGMFPVPFGIVIGGAVVNCQCLVLLYFSYQRITRQNPNFRSHLLHATLIFSFAISVALSLALYWTLFTNVSGLAQVAIGLCLPALKLGVKIFSKRMVFRKCNIHFAHGAGFLIEVCVGIFSAILFTAVDSHATFLLLLAFDVVENMFYTIQMVSLWIRRAQLMSSLNMKIVTNRMENSSPEVAYLAGNIFFGELVEIFAPLLMGTISCALYFAPSNVSSYMFFMADRTRDEFMAGMVYVLVDVTIEILLSIVIYKFVLKTTGINIIRVGLYLLQRDWFYYWSITNTAVLYYLSCFLMHNGIDATFQFSWLRENNNATNATAGS